MSGTGDAHASNNSFAGTGPVWIRKFILVQQAAAPRPPLDVAADALATAVRKKWNEEAKLRRLLEPAHLPVRWQATRRKVAGRIDGAIAGEGRARFAPLPGLTAVTRDVLRQGGALPELHAVYGGLASGRLLLVGEPAVGKTSAAVLLLLAALDYRADAEPDKQARIPVPVMLTPFGWDPAKESATDWAAGSPASTPSSGAKTGSPVRGNCWRRDGSRCSWTSSTRSIGSCAPPC
ncbi:hypothetical protein ACFRKB_30335 [Streptomyces scopuliridis]|uniref:hypothetical protein n=1 Tax=Streptomyces scopuliridis TaxID=452529 RepID=UPI0036A9EDBD